jgi:hypothetical protein
MNQFELINTPMYFLLAVEVDVIIYDVLSLKQNSI